MGNQNKIEVDASKEKRKKKAERNENMVDRNRFDERKIRRQKKITRKNDKKKMKTNYIYTKYFKGRIIYKY